MFMSTVLLVNEDLGLLELLTFALNRAGLDVLPAQGAASALRLLETGKPDLAVIDVDLGADHGLDLLRQVRRRGPIPVIMLTRAESGAGNLRGLELEADEYVSKPFSHQHFVARVKETLRRGAPP